MAKINKNIIIIISIAAILLLAGMVAWLISEKGSLFTPEEAMEQEKTAEQILKDLTPEQVKTLTPKEQQELQEVLKQLTAPQTTLTEQEQKDLEALLKQLTP